MNSPRFAILGTEVPPMLGRTKMLQGMCNDLSKNSPSHLSVVGPRFVGKSVLLKALEAQMGGSESPYCAIIRWDLGHQTPSSDHEFQELLCRRLGAGLRDAGNEYGDDLLETVKDEYDEICEVMDVLHGEGRKVLMLWDGFEKAISGGRLSRNLWDNLLDLCRRPSFRVVTSTRAELHKLIRDEKSVTSDFWGIFERIVRVRAFDDADIDTVLMKLPEFQFVDGARTELMNWSSGYPPFVLCLLNQIIDEYGSGKVEPDMINEAACRAMEKEPRLCAMLAQLWEDCPPRARDLYAVLTERMSLPADEVGREGRDALIERNFASLAGKRLQLGCRFLQRYLEGAGPDAGSMSRLFGGYEDYKNNIRGLLERRLSQIASVDERLSRYVELSIGHLPQDPELALSSLTSIEERSLDLIWRRELGDGRVFPRDTVCYWTSGGREGNKLIKKMMDDNSWEVPSDRGRQMGLLQLLTGSVFGFDSRAKATSKDTYVLINAVHCYRNRMEHPEGQGIDIGVAIAAIMTCLELLACLSREAVS